MGMRDLTTASMVTVTGALLDPERERPIFAKYPRLLPWLSDIEAAHEGLHEVQTLAPKVSPALSTLNERAASLDAEHDRLARGIFDTLSGLISLTEDTERASLLLRARDELFPKGLSIVNRTFLDEAGEAQLLDSRLSDGSRKLLCELPIEGVTLNQYVLFWQKAGLTLGEVEAERVRLAKDEKAQSIASLGRARLAWVSAMNALVFVIEREKELTQDDRRRLLEPLETALAKASAKKKAGAKHAQPEGEPVAEAEA